ncbi:hypothetical protein BKA59DRAFT_67350 [Fusarium tricinctum]|uniref:Zn(2)-C6 fungal-type domain-containing protein n=1 Tax=Fusarium tricinctum TaxID=61284 RepID=A0A8K0S477_9HYPO|nr:hypothetical protein BKA59DRAFT_67350 [Fusarium tricinctum]
MASSQLSALQSKPRQRRSVQACLTCRSRKVRCDVSLHGQPCTNCSLDEKQCQIAQGMTVWNPVNSRAKRRASQQTNDSIIVEDSAPKSAGAKNHNIIDPIAASETASSLDFLQQAEITAPWRSVSIDIPDFNDLLHPTFSLSGEQPSLPNFFANFSQSQYDAGAFLPMEPAVLPMDRPFKADRELVMYSHYRYLSAGNIHAIPHQDVTYLEAQGCLHVPIAPILDVFMSKYFAHIHLFLPLIDEGDFWEMYSQSSRSNNTISLFVLYAMLFTSCNFVPVDCLKRLGYSDIHSARADLYRKTKLLYDHDIESGHLPLAQGALLLMNWVPNFPVHTSPNPWKTWHGLAFRHADNISAHRYARVADVPVSTSPSQKRYFRSVRRLWWCCIIMDRLSPLCTRFRPQLTPESLALDTYVPLGFNDFQTEIHRSRVFAPAIKRRHIEVFSKFLELILVLTDVLAIAFPYESKVEISPESAMGSDAQVQKCRRSLAAWYKSATIDFPLFDGHDRDRRSDTRDPSNSVILYTNLMYIYYHTACITLCNYRIFSWLSTVRSSVANLISEDVTIPGSEICGDVEFSALELTRCVGALKCYRLTNSLPVTTVACIATPLALQLITSRLSSLRRELALDHMGRWPDIDPVSNQSRLDMLIEATDAFLPHYYGVDWVKETAKHTADLAQAYNQRLAQPDREAVTDWGQILVKYPDTYLRLTWTVDLCISRGKVPQDQDFPLCLRNGSDKGRASFDFGDKFDACQYLDTSSEGSPSELDRLLGLAEPSVGQACDEVMTFENTFGKETESISI